MRSKFLFGLFILVIFTSCNGPKKVKIVGVALDAKAGAGVIVEGETLRFYYVEGLLSWDEIYLEKVVSITGYLDTIIEPHDTTLVHTQYVDDSLRIFGSQHVDCMYLIRKPKYKTIDSIGNVPFGVY